jgi:hypothetical protein
MQKVVSIWWSTRYRYTVSFLIPVLYIENSQNLADTGEMHCDAVGQCAYSPFFALERASNHLNDDSSLLFEGDYWV